ncbi:GL26818 [Drosophila persimilis]|uniref:GL26818 n=1 Tax=Drosophila persimilis TaxID=7234 RepID=B4H2D1_DROPE|nr:GL26818 [Drosophila persimilis]
MDFLKRIAIYFIPPPAQEPTIIDITKRLCLQIWDYFRPPPPPVRFLGDDNVINALNVSSLILVFVCPFIMGIYFKDLVKLCRKLYHWKAMLRQIDDMENIEEDDQSELSEEEEEIAEMEDGAREVARLEDDPNELALVPVPEPIQLPIPVPNDN